MLIAEKTLPCTPADDSDSIPSHLGDLDLSIGEDSGLVVGMDDDDSDGGLGNVAGGGSSGSVF